jgi:hypothetical protein
MRCVSGDPGIGEIREQGGIDAHGTAETLSVFFPVRLRQLHWFVKVETKQTSRAERELGGIKGGKVIDIYVEIRCRRWVIVRTSGDVDGPGAAHAVGIRTDNELWRDSSDKLRVVKLNRKGRVPSSRTGQHEMAIVERLGVRMGVHKCGDGVPIWFRILAGEHHGLGEIRSVHVGQGSDATQAFGAKIEIFLARYDYVILAENVGNVIHECARSRDSRLRIVDVADEP